MEAVATTPPGRSAVNPTGEPSAAHELAQLLALRGIVSGVSRTTACLWGVEHLMNHMRDLHHMAHRQPVGLVDLRDLLDLWPPDRIDWALGETLGG
jgi:glycerol-1-phosphate dehydrogenase [NAD(P)+]